MTKAFHRQKAGRGRGGGGQGPYGPAPFQSQSYFSYLRCLDNHIVNHKSFFFFFTITLLAFWPASFFYIPFVFPFHYYYFEIFPTPWKLSNSGDRYGSAHACQKLLGHGLLCPVSVFKLHLEKPGRVVCTCVVWCYICCYGCRASQEGRHVSAVPRAPGIFSSLLACARLAMGSGNSAPSETR